MKSKAGVVAMTVLLAAACCKSGSGQATPAATSSTPPAVSTNGIVNNASFAAGSNALAPGTIVAVFGTNLTDGTSCLPPSCNPSFQSDHRLNSTLAGAQVMVNGTPAPIFYASPNQLGIQIPTEVTGTSAAVQVIVNGQSSNTANISIGPFSPGIFTFTADGKGAGAITHADGTPVSGSSPAQPGETVVIYSTGLGQITPAVPTGETPAATTSTVATPTVTIDGIPAQVQFSGLAGCCIGLNQINVVVPSNVHRANNVSVVLSIGGQQANLVTMATASGPSAPPPTAAITLSSLAFNSPTVTGGSNDQGMVVLSAAPSSGTIVALSSSNSSVVSVPPSVTVAAGSTSATFTITASASLVTTSTVTITASEGGVTQTAMITATPPPLPITLYSLAFTSTTVIRGSNFQGMVVLSAAPSSATTVALSSGNSSVVSVPSSVTVAAGSTNATFTITASASLVTTSTVTITASEGGVTQTATITVTPPLPPITLSSLVINTTTATAGSTYQGMVVLSAAPSADTTVALSSSNSSAVSVPPSVTVAAGSTSATFTITTGSSAANTAVTITASEGGVTQMTVLTVTPLPQPAPGPPAPPPPYYYGY